MADRLRHKAPWVPAALVVTGLLVSTVACQPTRTTPPGSLPSSDGQIATVPSGPPLTFPSRNATVLVPLNPVPARPRVFSQQGGTDVEWSATVADGGLTVTKPLDSGDTGSLTVMDGGRVQTVLPYTAESGQVDLRISSNGFQAAFALRPVEAQSLAGDRQIRIPTGRPLSLWVDHVDTPVATIQVDPQGRVANTPGRVIGGPGTLHLDTWSLAFDPGDVTGKVQVSPLERESRAGKRLIQALPGIATLRVVWPDGTVIADQVHVDETHRIWADNGAVNSLQGNLQMVTVTKFFDTDNYDGPWNLYRYETGYQSGSRTLPIFKGDQRPAVLLNEGQGYFFDAAGPPGMIAATPNGFKFNNVTVTFDPGPLALPYHLWPLDRNPMAGKRSIRLPVGARCGVLVNGLSPSMGDFHVESGTVKADSHSLQVTDNSTLRLQTVSVQVYATGSTPYRILPYETAHLAGGRTLTMIRGAPATVETPTTFISLQVDQNGVITSGSSQASGGMATLTVNP